MASTEDRLRVLIADNLEVDGKPVDSNMPLSSSLGEHGVSSMDLVSFARVVQSEFRVEMTVDDCVKLQNIGELIEYLDSRSS